MMKYIFITTISLFFSTIAFGQTGVLTGIIVTPDGKPAEHISVSLQGTSSTAHTNQSGRFTLRSDTGNYQLGVYSVGIKSQVFPVAIRENDTTKIPKIVLEKNKQQLQEVVISAQRGSYQTNKASNSLRLTESL
ncbi:MAG: carboxypeptidase-like regulatory domain-containing protein, partial [Chitinophagaceae bacterium]